MSRPRLRPHADQHHRRAATEQLVLDRGAQLNPRRAAPRSAAAEAERIAELRKRLKLLLPEPRCELHHRNAFELLVATILSAQSTDARVNQVTPALFRRFPTPAALAQADSGELEALIHSTGFYRNKAKSLLGASRMLVERHGGEVPRALEALVELPGVARKTANVVIGTAYGLATGFIVDTHVARVAVRLGLTKQTEPAKIEAELCTVFPKREWVDMGHRLVLHGRYLCKAKKPECAHCALQEVCPSEEHEPEGSVADRARYERERIG